MGIWEVEKIITKVKKYKITGVLRNYLKNNEDFRFVSKRKDGKCQLCQRRFNDGENVALALNEGTGGNLFICDTCCDEAIENGVTCRDMGKK